MERPFPIRRHLTALASKARNLDPATETLASSRPSNLSALSCMAGQMFKYCRLDRLAATEDLCMSVVTATMRSNAVALGRFTSVRRAAQVRSQEDVIRTVRCSASEAAVPVQAGVFLIDHLAVQTVSHPRATVTLHSCIGSSSSERSGHRSGDSNPCTGMDAQGPVSAATIRTFRFALIGESPYFDNLDIQWAPYFSPGTRPNPPAAITPAEHSGWVQNPQPSLLSE
jgi:hypothetical protein